MELIGKGVSHKLFGSGIVVNVEGKHMDVQFQNFSKTFVYPDAFQSYLRISDVAMFEIIEKALREKESQVRETKKEEKNKGSSVVRPDKEKERNNIAFKCNYCDGGVSRKVIGYNGVCSDKIINYNINVVGRAWCSADDAPCMAYNLGEIKRRELDSKMVREGFVCYESQMLRDWKAFAGIVNTGKRKGSPMKLNQLRNNSLAILTTIEPHKEEKSRFIFAVFLVNENYEGDNDIEGYVSSSSKYRISLSPEEAPRFLFWNYHANKNKPESSLWSSGLHRYYDDLQAANILKDLVEIKKGTLDENLSKEFFEYFCKTNNIDSSTLLPSIGSLKMQ